MIDFLGIIESNHSDYCSQDIANLAEALYTEFTGPKGPSYLPPPTKVKWSWRKGGVSPVRILDWGERIEPWNRYRPTRLKNAYGVPTAQKDSWVTDWFGPVLVILPYETVETNFFTPIEILSLAERGRLPSEAVAQLGMRLIQRPLGLAVRRTDRAHLDGCNEIEAFAAVQRLVKEKDLRVRVSLGEESQSRVDLYQMYTAGQLIGCMREKGWLAKYRMEEHLEAWFRKRAPKERESPITSLQRLMRFFEAQEKTQRGEE